ncbi:MAG: hypothetical protein MUE69_26375 [Myxococcota bacterium]|jgi:hypothetical protein|nr:hypothetical protein [Myxococcota bacterium]
MIRTWLVIPLLALVACANAGEDFENICHAEARSGAASIADPAQRAQHIAQWLEANVSSSDAKEAMAALAHASPESRGELLRAAARELGYTGDCPMADAR